MPITGPDGEFSYRYDASKHLKGVPEEDREEATYQAGEAALQKIHEYMDAKKSPVKGIRKNFDSLSDKYAEFKRSKVGNENPNLRLSGKLIESMDVDSDENSFTISIDDSDEIAKAYNHNEGDTLPMRKFMPHDDRTKNNTFKKEIVDTIKKVIKRYKKPKRGRPEAVAPVEVASENYQKLFATFQATKREQKIAQNLSLFKIKDIL